jgi:hypothetical protein
LRFANCKQRVEIEKEMTDLDYMYILNEPSEELDVLIKTLMGQYSFGQAPKNELKNLLEIHNIK